MLYRIGRRREIEIIPGRQDSVTFSVHRNWGERSSRVGRRPVALVADEQTRFRAAICVLRLMDR
jgi:hypothetical protein